MHRKKILYLSQAFPFPDDGGGKIKTLNTLKALSSKYDVYAVFVSEYQPSVGEVAHLTNLGIKVKVFYSEKIHWSVKDDYGWLCKNFIKGNPHYIFQYENFKAKKFISKEIYLYKPDVIHVDHLNLAQYLPKEKNQKWILESHNFESLLYWTRLINSRNVKRKIYLLIEMIFTYFYERKMLSRFDCIFSISNKERKKLIQVFKLGNIKTQPLVYGTKEIRKQKTSKQILFIGSVRWPPNEEAVRWFCKEIFPKIKARDKKVKFVVVGKRYEELEREIGKIEGVIFKGYQRDISKYLKKASVFVLPFSMGAGVRFKALTAMSYGVPIVSTHLGVDGLNMKSGVEYVLAESANDFSEKVWDLINDRKMNETIGNSGFKYLKNNHSILNNNKFIKMYDLEVSC